MGSSPRAGKVHTDLVTISILPYLCHDDASLEIRPLLPHGQDSQEMQPWERGKQWLRRHCASRFPRRQMSRHGSRHGGPTSDTSSATDSDTGFRISPLISLLDQAKVIVERSDVKGFGGFFTLMNDDPRSPKKTIQMPKRNRYKESMTYDEVSMLIQDTRKSKITLF